MGTENREPSKSAMLYFQPVTTLDQLNARGQGYLPGLIGIAEGISIEPERLSGRLILRPELLAPNGYLQAATIIALADTACSYGTSTAIPSGAKNLTMIELKTNFSRAFAYNART